MGSYVKKAHKKCMLVAMKWHTNGAWNLRHPKWRIDIVKINDFMPRSLSNLILLKTQKKHKNVIRILNKINSHTFLSRYLKTVHVKFKKNKRDLSFLVLWSLNCSPEQSASWCLPWRSHRLPDVGKQALGFVLHRGLLGELGNFCL